MPDQEQSAVHHVQQALVDEFVLLVYYRDDALLDGKCNWDEELVLCWGLF